MIHSCEFIEKLEANVSSIIVSLSSFLFISARKMSLADNSNEKVFCIDSRLLFQESHCGYLTNFILIIFENMFDQVNEVIPNTEMKVIDYFNSIVINIV